MDWESKEMSFTITNQVTAIAHIVCLKSTLAYIHIHQFR